MSRFSALCLMTVAVATGFTACNTNGDSIYENKLPSSTLVTGFSLSANSKVLDNLDKVFFSIDLTTGNIFNADSLPYGTDVHALVPVITTTGVSALELIVPRPGQSDTTYNYLTNSTDSINFSNGPVSMRLTSYDDAVTTTYTVKVNVHKVKSDSLAWGNAAYAKLPSTLSPVTLQHTVKLQDKVYTLTSDDKDYCMAVTDNPDNCNWEMFSVNFGFSPVVETLRSSTDGLYIISLDRKLYKSTDGGHNWTQTTHIFDNLIGGYGENVIGTVYENGKWYIASTDGSRSEAAETFPVSGFSIPIEYSFPMSESHQFTIVGGRLASGELTSSCWGFDGTNWACLTPAAFNEGVEEMTVVPYFIFSENQFFIATSSSIFVAFGGQFANGSCNRTVYISYNYGMSWKKASDEMQLPADVPAMHSAQGIVLPQTLTSRSAQTEWTPIAIRPLPPCWVPINTITGSRASEEITSWECPFIYVFGGMDKDFYLHDTIWRAVINRLMFKPIQ